jgi:NTE family protein
VDKVGLVLGGGGVRGAYQVGAIKALYEIGFKCDIVTGTSVGALNALLVAQEDISVLEKVWYSVDFENVMDYKHKLKNKSLETFLMAPLKGGFSLSPLGELVEKHIDEEKVRNSNIKLGIVITENLKKYSPYTIDDIPKGKLNEYLLASCSAWPFLKKRKIDGKVAFDGYFTDNLPIKLAQDMGAKKIIAFDLVKGFRVKTDERNVLIIKPKNMCFFLNFEKEIIDNCIEAGYNDVMSNREIILQFLSN